MDLPRTLFDVIDTRSFSSLWFWILLAVIWSQASHRVLGVPYDLVQRARREGGRAQADLEDLVRINVGRLLFVARVSGPWLGGLAAFALTALAVLGVWYDVEVAQAVGLIALPLAAVGALTLRAARRIDAEGQRGEAVLRSLGRHRFWTQAIGLLSIFVTAMYGMYRNLAVVPGF